MCTMYTTLIDRMAIVYTVNTLYIQKLWSYDYNYMWLPSNTFISYMKSLIIRSDYNVGVASYLH